jgi:glycosyltransferase involved in cell wall biosynthesis
MTDKLIMGGAEVYFCKLENLLDQECKDASFFTAAAGGELFNKIRNKANFIPLTRKRHLVNMIRLFREVKKREIDVIHANSLRMVFYAIGVQKMVHKNLKIIYTKHNITIFEKRNQRLLAGVLNSSINRVITVSEHERENLIKIGVKPEKVITIHNGVDLNQFSYHQKVSEKSVFHVGILGRLSEEKNHKLFLDIAKALKNVSGLKFYIAGNGPEFSRIKAMIKEYDLTDSVVMLGEVDTPEKFIADMDVLLLTSHREVFPMVLLEAMAVGTPIISINTGGISEAIDDNETGFLITSYSVDAFIEKIMEMRSNKEVRNSFSKSGRVKVESKFTSENMTRLTLNEYLNL